MTTNGYLPAVVNGTALATSPASVSDFTVNKADILRALGINPADPKAQALILVCQRYDLDPVLKHAVLISGTMYVTRDGLLHVAHSSGQFDGLEVETLPDTNTHFVAAATVWRKDMGRPIRFQGRYPKAGRGGPGAQYGPEMAEKVAVCRALRHAFDVSLCSKEELWEEEADPHPRNITPPRQSLPEAPAAEESPAPDSTDDEKAAKARLVALFTEFAAAVDKQSIGELIRNDQGAVSRGKMKDLIARVLDFEGWGEEETPHEGDIQDAIAALPPYATDYRRRRQQEQKRQQQTIGAGSNGGARRGNAAPPPATGRTYANNAPTPKTDEVPAPTATQTAPPADPFGDDPEDPFA